MRMSGMATRINPRWEQVADFTGEIVFYGTDAKGVRHEWSTYFFDGKLQQLHKLAPQ
jgi:hypothetical protein